MSIGGGLRWTNDFQSVNETFSWQDRSLMNFMEIRSVVIVWLGAPLLVFGGGLRSMDEFKNVMVTSLALDAYLVNFHEDVISSYRCPIAGVWRRYEFHS